MLPKHWTTLATNRKINHTQKKNINHFHKKMGRGQRGLNRN